MLSIPHSAHRYLIEPLSGRPHIVKSLRKRFLAFLSKIRKSKKIVLCNILMEIENDCRSTTGRNIRNLKLLANNFCMEKIDVETEPYHKVPADFHWRMVLVKEIIAIKSGELGLGDLTYDNLDNMLEFVCSS